MSSVSGAECVVDINVAKACEILGEGFAVLGLLGAEAGVLKQDYVAVLHSGNGCPCIVADNIVVSCKNDFLAELLAESLCNGCKGELSLGAVLGLAEMGAEDDLCAVVYQLLYGGKSRIDPVLIGDNAVLEGDVEVAAHENSLALCINIVYGFLVK